MLVIRGGGATGVEDVLDLRVLEPHRLDARPRIQPRDGRSLPGGLTQILCDSRSDRIFSMVTVAG